MPFDSSYALVFDDEFNGTTLDSSKWGTGWLAAGITPPTSGSQTCCFDPAKVTVSGGNLNLALVSETHIVGGVTFTITGSMVETHRVPNLAWTFGYFEARIFLPAAPGTAAVANWPAFWLDGAALNWPVSGELDVMEGLGGLAAGHFHSSAGGPSGGSKSGMGGDWHIYAAWWRPGRVDWYYDNVLIGSVTSGITSVPQFMILNNSTGSAGGTQVLGSSATMLVDWVHIYQSGGTPVTPQVGYTGPGGGGTP